MLDITSINELFIYFYGFNMYYLTESQTLVLIQYLTQVQVDSYSGVYGPPITLSRYMQDHKIRSDFDPNFLAGFEYLIESTPIHEIDELIMDLNRSIDYRVERHCYKAINEDGKLVKNSPRWG